MLSLLRTQFPYAPKELFVVDILSQVYNCHNRKDFLMGGRSNRMFMYQLLLMNLKKWKQNIIAN